MKKSNLFAALMLCALAAHAQIPLQQSTAAQAVKFGPFVDSTDGNTEKTGLTIANTDIKCSKNGGTLASKNSGGGTHDANGWYTATLDATDTNTAGRLTCYVHVSGALPVFREFMVYPTANYAALYSTAPGAAGGLQIAGSNAATTFAALTVTGPTTHTGNVSMAAGLNITQSASNAAALVVTGNGSGNGATITSGSGATGDGLKVASAATNGNGYSSQGTGTGSGDLMTGGATGHGASGVGGSTSGFGLKATTTLPVGPNPLFGIGESGKLQSATSTTAVLAASTSFPDASQVGKTLGIIAGTGVGQSRSITGWTSSTDTATVAPWTTTPDNTSVYYLWDTAAASGGSGPDAPTIADAVMDELLSGHTTSGSVGERLSRLPNVAAGGSGGLPTVDASNAVKVQSGTGANQISLASGLVTVGTNNDKTGYTLSNAGIDAFADRSVTGHTAGGTWGGTWNAAGSSGDPWSITLPGAYTAGQAGYIVGNNLNAPVSSRMSTFTLPTNFSSLSIDGSGRTLLQPTQTGVTIPIVTTLTTAPSDEAGVTTLLGRLSAARAGYFDNLSAGAVATQVSVNAMKATSDKVDTALELDGGVYRLTANALEQAPVGGGGSTNITQIEGLDATDQIDARIAAANLATAAALAAAKADTTAIKQKTDGLTFTLNGQVDANAESMNAHEILGAGTAANPWNGE